MQTLLQNDCWKIHTGYAHLHLIARHLSCQRSNRKQSSHDKMASGVGSEYCSLCFHHKHACTAYVLHGAEGRL